MLNTSAGKKYKQQDATHKGVSRAKEEQHMKQVAKIIIHNNKEFLLQLRDDNPHIKFPLHWNLLGGVVEEGEDPENTLRRELQEELGISIENVTLFTIEEHNETKQYIFSARSTIDPSRIKLNEGLALRWFKDFELPSLKIGFNYYEILQKFLRNDG